VTIALASRWKCSRIAQCIASQLRKLFQAVETFDKRFDGGHGIGLAPIAAQWRVKSRSHQPPEPSTVCVSSHFLFWKSVRNNNATCR
jgi:hypothetical protein